MSSTYDLVSLATAEAALAQSLPTDTTYLAPVISAASYAIRRWTGRDFVQNTYDECYNGAGFSQMTLRQYPIIGPLARLAINPTPVLTISNTSTTNQRALASLATTGDIDSGLTVSGFTLTAIASGVTTTDSSTLFATYPTIQTCADHINGIGNGWKATVGQGYGGWASADLRAIQGSANAATYGGNNGAAFYVHVTDLNNFTVDERTGLIRLNVQGWDPMFALMNLNSAPFLTSFPPGFQNIRAVYTAGYPTIPWDVQQACLITIRDWSSDLQTTRIMESETFADYSYKFFSRPDFGLSDQVKGMLLAYKAFRRF